ncbi:MAG TPA: TonB-dependent receptor [Holophagaceae bacterium]|nr:TonB-dependent receptor [Holophagaceae bacterium]
MAFRASSRSLGLLALSSISLSLAAQSTGVTTSDLKGTVRLANGTVVPGASVRLTQDSTNQSRTISTDGNGAFAFRLLPPGSYTLLVEAKGMSSKKISSLQLRLGQTTDLPVDLSPVEAQATVEITGEATVVDPTRTTVSATIDNNFITNLPINRRDFTAFSLTTPQVAKDNGPTSQGGAASSSGLSFSGQNARANNIMVDGLDNNDVSVGSTRTTFSQDAIQEFVVVANGFSAEYGRAAGGTLNIITKSGGNDFSGSAFYFFRNSSMEAKRPLAGSTNSDFKQTQFGATVGGPLVKDKLFYFVSVERFNRDDSNRITIGQNYTIGANAQPVDLYAAINTATGITVTSGAQGYNENYTTGIVKLDWVQSDNSRWNLRYSQAKEVNENQLPWSGQMDRSAGGAREIKDSSLSLGNTWTASSTFVNDFRVLYSNRDHSLLSLDDTHSPYISMQGYGTVGTQRFLPQLRKENNIELVDTTTFFVGSHTLKAGIDLMQTHLEGTLPLQFAGVYRFQALGNISPTVAIANGLQAFTGVGVDPTTGNSTPALNPFNGQPGLPFAFVQGFGDYYLNYKAKYYSAFIQDDWQLTPSFSLKVGLRYDKEELPKFNDAPDYDALEAGGASQLASFTLNAIPTSTGATGANGKTYESAPLFKTQRDWSSSRVSPRVAFNWQVSPSNRIYGGYGHFSGRTQLGPYSAVYLNNGRDLVTVIQTPLETISGAPSPWYSWAQPNHRYLDYASVPTSANKKGILLPGKYEMPLTKQANLGWEITPRPNLRFTLDAVHVKGSNFLNVRDVNAAVPNPAFGAPGQLPTRRVDTRYAAVHRYDGSGESKHTSVSLGTAWQMQERLSLSFSYTWSKTEDNYTDWVTDVTPRNTFDTQDEMGTSNQDQRHRILASLVYNTKGFNNAFTKDWVISLIGRFASGRPYSQFTGVDNDYGIVGGRPWGNFDGGAPAADRPNGVDRNSETLPFSKNVDLRVSRTFRFEKKAALEVMLDVFNVFNHYNVSAIQNVQNAPNYGQPIVQSNVDFNRQMQIGARFTF